MTYDPVLDEESRTLSLEQELLGAGGFWVSGLGV